MPSPPGLPAELAELQDDYELLGELGRGGAAVVYRARDRALGRDVAIKVVHPRPTSPDDDPVARLAREARTVAQLQHPNIVAVYAVRRLRDGGLALIMQFVPGATLKTVIQRGGALAPERVEAVLRDVASALAYAHARGLVHRDVKPENIFLDGQTGRALLADFGIARSTEVDSTTMAGTAVGTPFYMSPEQVDGAVLDGRSDLYSLGLVAWEALTGQRPWDGESLYNVIYKQKFEELPPIEALRPDVPRRLQYLVERMLQKRPGARWAGAEGLLAQLDHAVLPADYARWQRALPARVERFEAARVRQAADRGFGGPPDGPSAAASTMQFSRDTAGARNAISGAHQSEELASMLAPDAEHTRRAPWVPSPVAGPGAPTPDLDGAVLLPAPGATIDLQPGSEAAQSAGFAANAGAARPLSPRTYADLVEPTWLAEDASSATPRRRGVRPRTVALAGAAAAVAVVVTAASSGQLASAWSAVRTRSRAAIGTGPARDVAAADAPGTGTLGVLPAPARASGFLTAGGRHSCALTEGGRAYCWGANERGQVGDGSATAARRVPVPVAGVLDFESTTSGFAHTCALTRLGEAYCWGANARGQLGDATTVQRNAPVRVAGSGLFTAVAAGAAHSCAVATDGAVHCWGANDQGQIGDGPRTARSVPTTLRVAGGVTRVAAGGQHTCAVTATGRLYCWGANADGQLGVGPPGPAQSTPQLVPLPGLALAVSTGLAHTCALTNEGVAWCWGRNDSGQLGDGTRLTRARPTRTQLAPDRALVNVVSGAAHTCGLDASGVLWCWGRNGRGAVGDGSVVNRPAPTLVRLPAPAVTVAAGTAHTCATTAATETLCWGDNLDGQLGNNTVAPRPTPTRVRYPQRVVPRAGAVTVTTGA